MSDGTDDLVEQYSQAQKTGQEYIGKAWKQLRDKTRLAFTSTGFYDDWGKRLSPEEYSTNVETEVENIEYQIGVLKLCADSQLPKRTEAKAIIYREAFTDDVLHASLELVYHTKWHDPQFFRLALSAIPIHQRANLMLRLPVQKENKSFVLKGLFAIAMALFSGLLILVSPYVLAMALTSASNHDVPGSTGAFYLLGFTAWLYLLGKNLAKPSEGNVSADEKAYLAWDRLSYSTTVGPWLGNGTGAKIYFEKIANDGVPVPLVVFDLCSALEYSSLS